MTDEVAERRERGVEDEGKAIVPVFWSLSLFLMVGLSLSFSLFLSPTAGRIKLKGLGFSL